jgi:hypothetical protein
LDAAERARTFGLVSTVGFAVGLTALATSAVLFITEPRPKKKAARAMPNELLVRPDGRGLLLGVGGRF